MTLRVSKRTRDNDDKGLGDCFVFICLDFTANLKSVLLRYLGIEDHEIRPLSLDLFDGLIPICCRNHVIALVQQKPL